MSFSFGQSRRRTGGLLLVPRDLRLAERRPIFSEIDGWIKNKKTRRAEVLHQIRRHESTADVESQNK